MYGIFSYVRKRADTAPTKLAGVPIVMCGPKKRKLVLRATSPGSKHLPQHGCNAAWLSVKRWGRYSFAEGKMTTCKKRASHRKAADANSWEPVVISSSASFLGRAEESSLHYFE